MGMDIEKVHNEFDGHQQVVVNMPTYAVMLVHSERDRTMFGEVNLMDQRQMDDVKCNH